MSHTRIILGNAMYELYNTATEEIEATQNMEKEESEQRNAILRAGHELQRWIRQSSIAEEIGRLALREKYAERIEGIDIPADYARCIGEQMAVA